MKRKLLRALCSLVFSTLALVPVVHAQYDADRVLLENRWTRVTTGDYEAELMRLPPDIRGGFAANGKRVYELLARLLTTKSLAAQARAANLDKDPALQHRLALEIDRVHAGLQISKIEQAAGQAFDARHAQFEARAREIYLSRRDSYRIPEQVAASHILFDTKKHSKEEALKLAQETRTKILAGADFNEVAKPLSDDPSARLNAGRMDYFDKPKMDPAFADAAFALKNVGDVSDPVLSTFGYHLIRLDGRKPASLKTFDEVKDSIIAQERARYIDEQRELALSPIRNDPDTKVDQAAIDALVVKINSGQLKSANEPAGSKK